ncbi:hypothetical protein [Rummeliibacillus pycnus]|uniref:hypothetical protein n=1 Tax=Rummeliibacillus pycnus TaxID=101070 RepID=UPI003D2C3402
MTEYNVHEVLAILQKYYITESPQMVTRWIREGKIQGIRSENRREGYRVSEDDLLDYIEELRPGLPAIMEIYEEYIKNLGFQQNEEEKQSQDNIQNLEIEQESKVREYEKEIKDLRDQIYNLETELIDLQQEKQIVEMNVIDLMEENDKLTVENNDLTELFEISDKEIIQLKNRSLQINTVISESEGDVKQIKMTLDEFKKLTSDMILKLELDHEDPITVNLLYTIFNELFENDLLKSDLVTATGNIKCPYTKKEYKQVKRLINNAIKYYFENINEQQDNQEHNEIYVANE